MWTWRLSLLFKMTGEIVYLALRVFVAHFGTTALRRGTSGPAYLFPRGHFCGKTRPSCRECPGTV